MTTLPIDVGILVKYSDLQTTCIKCLTEYLSSDFIGDKDKIYDSSLDREHFAER